MLLLLVLLCQLCSSSGGSKFVFQVEPGREECFYQAVTASKSLVVSYQAGNTTPLLSIGSGEGTIIGASVSNIMIQPVVDSLFAYP